MSQLNIFLNKLGRAELAGRLGVTIAAVSNHSAAGKLPADWFLVTRELAKEKDLICSVDLFKFRPAKRAADAGGV